MIIRISKDKNNPYVIINKQFLQDNRLSWKAKGIMSYLLSLPDDWQIYEEELSKHSKDGLKALKSGIKELLFFKYLSRHKTRTNKGQYAGWEYIVYETSPTIPKADVGFSDVRKRQVTNNDVTDNDLTNYNNDNGVFPNGKDSYCVNRDVVNAMKTYMTNYYKQRTKKKHPYLKPEQNKSVYQNIASFAEENCLDQEGIEEVMLCYFNNKAIDTDWNINHFATEGIMMNRLYECDIT